MTVLLDFFAAARIECFGHRGGTLKIIECPGISKGEVFPFFCEHRPARTLCLNPEGLPKIISKPDGTSQEGRV
jgi:hypothetical protein